LPDGTPISLKTLFPGDHSRIFAEWYSGELRVPLGGLIQYQHYGFGSVYQRDLFISIEKGAIKSENTIVNGIAPSNAPQNYQLDAMTLFGMARSREPKKC
jgi:hypothetical protein